MNVSSENVTRELWMYYHSFYPSARTGFIAESPRVSKVIGWVGVAAVVFGAMLYLVLIQLACSSSISVLYVVGSE